MNSLESQAPVPRFSRRVSSAPAVSLSSRPGRSLDGRSGSVVETLFVQPDVKIVQFSTSGQPVLENLDAARREAGSWPPCSRTERTIAMGTLSIYRAPGSVAFLNCGSALQPILPKSQCWCIDEGNATFVLQIRRPNYWRIELRHSDEELRDAVGLRDVLSDVLQFEKTYCPFQRSFTVDIPEESLVSVKKKAWSPKHVPGATKFAGAPGSLANALSENDLPSDRRPMTAEGRLNSSTFAEKSSFDGEFGPPSLEPCHSDESSSYRVTPKSCSTAQQGLSPGRLNTSQSLLDTNGEGDIRKPGITTEDTDTTQPRSAMAVTHLQTELSRSTTSAQHDLPSGGEPQLIRPNQLGQAGELLVQSPYTRPEQMLGPGNASETAVAANSQHIPVVATLDLNFDSCVHEPDGRASPAPSQDSFHSVSSHSSSPLTAIGQEAKDLPDTINASENNERIDSLDIHRHLADPGSRLHPRQFLKSGLVRNSSLNLVVKTSELLLGPPAYLIALMVKIAAKIRGGGRATWMSPNPNSSDDDVPVFYDFFDSDLDD